MDQFVSAMFGQPGSNVIALFAALLSFTAAAVIYVFTARRERRIEKSSAYLDLEVQSSEAFRYQAQNAHLMRPLRQLVPPSDKPAMDHPSWEVTMNYYFQCLNLFEVCSNFRRHKIVGDEVFASWLAWFYDILKDWHFREIWALELRSNYTRDVRNIFDVGVKIFGQHADEETRLREFYKAASHLIGGWAVVAGWLDNMAEAPEWPPTSRTPPFGGSRRITYRAMGSSVTPPSPPPPKANPLLNMNWNGPGDAPLAAAFAASVIGRDAAYISHGEIQAGLSLNSETWAPNLADLYAADFADLEDRDLLVARNATGVIVAVAIVAWEHSPRRRFAVIEDMAVHPKARSSGVGALVLEALTARIAERGVEWVFLESGIRNIRAHSFFRKHGFDELSHVFARRLRTSSSIGGGA